MKLFYYRSPVWLLCLCEEIPSKTSKIYLITKEKIWMLDTQITQKLYIWEGNPGRDYVCCVCVILLWVMGFVLYISLHLLPSPRSYKENNPWETFFSFLFIWIVIKIYIWGYGSGIWFLPTMTYLWQFHRLSWKQPLVSNASLL